MPRLTQSLPSYRKHKASGQAIVTLAGVDHYLGPHGPAASVNKYDRLIAEFLANGRQTVRSEPITVTILGSRFLNHANSYYVKDGNPTTEVGEFRRVIRKGEKGHPKSWSCAHAASMRFSVAGRDSGRMLRLNR